MKNLINNLKRMDLKNKQNIYILVTIGVLLASLVGATFAYFTAQLGNGAESDINASSGRTESLMFEKTGDISITADQTDFYEGAPDKFGEASVKAILTPSDVKKQAERTYNVYFIVDDNDFIYSTKEEKKPELILQIKDPTGNIVKNIPGLTYIEDKEGFDITEKRTMAFKIAEDYDIKATDDTPTTQEWQIKVTLVNLPTNQYENAGKTFRGRIQITTDDQDTYKLINVNSITPDKDWHSITATTNIDEGTAGVDKYYFAIEKTSEEPATMSFRTIAENLSYTYHESSDNNYTFNTLDDGSELEPNQNYKIYSYVIDKEGYRSNIYTEVIKTDKYEPVEIGKVTYNVTWNSIKITNVETIAGTGEAQYYRFKKETDKNWSEYSESPTMEFNNLDSSTPYRILVQVKDTNGKEGVHKEELITTAEYNNVKVTPSITDITDTSMKVVVSTVNGTGNVEKVEIQNGSEPYQQASLEEGNYVYTFSNLTAGANYTFNIKVTDSNKKVVLDSVSDRAHWKVTVTVDNGDSVPSWAHVANGKETSFQVSANEHYNINAATASPDNCTISNGELKVKNVTSNITCNVVIPKVTNLVTVNVVNGSSEPTSYNVPYNESKTFTISANTGYDLTKAKVTSGDCTLSPDGATLTASNVTSPMTCKVEIPKVTNLVTVNVVNGSSEPTSYNVPYNESKTFTISANEGYDLTKASVKEGTCSLSNNGATLTASNVISPMTCKVEIPKKGSTINTVCPNGGVLSSCVTQLASKEDRNVGDGNLYYHDASLTDGAKDGSYRYSGNEPNNYVCLGTKTTSGGCNDNKNLYRIIGVIPVKVNGGATQNLIKLIKSEYITKEELGGWGSSTYGDSSGVLTLDSSGAQYARIKNQSGINRFYWSGSSSNSSNEWQKSSLYTTLNNATTGYLSKMGEWKDKIETVTWNIAGVSSDEYQKPTKDVFTVEMNNSTTGSKQTTTKTVDAQVGLMYASDYGFAASKDNWQTSIYSYDNDTNRSANWLYNAVYEWTISRSSAYSANALRVNYRGNVNNDPVGYYAYGVRPSFYLKSTVKYLEGEGSYEKPIFLG